MRGQRENEPGRSWWELLQALRARLRQFTLTSSLDWALTQFFLKNQEGISAKSLQLAPFDLEGFLGSYVATPTNTATLGFLLAAKVTQGNGPQKKFLEGLKRCTRQRQPTHGPSVHTDPKLLLGLSAGLAALGRNSEYKSWLDQQLQFLSKHSEPNKNILGSYGEIVLGNSSYWKVLEHNLLKTQSTDPLDIVMVLWALHLDPSQFSDQSREALESLKKQSLKVLPLLDIGQLDGLATIISLNLVSRLLQTSIMDLEQTALGRLIAILEKLPVGWAREKAEPTDEYDIQRVMWTMLTGVYPDLRDEQWLAQFGVYQPRADLAIEPLKTVVEAKFVKRSSGFRKIQEEIISDAASYTAKPERFDKVIAVIYDATSSQHKHGQLRETLEKQRGIVKVLIFSKFIPRPTKRKASRRPKQGSLAEEEEGEKDA